MATKRPKRKKSPRSRPYGGTGGGKPQRYRVGEVEYVLRKCFGNYTLAARTLGCERSTLYDYLHRFPERLAGIRHESRREIADLGEGVLLQALRRGATWAVKEVLRLYGSHIGIGEHVDITSDGAPLAVAPPVTFNISYVRSRFKGGELAERREANAALLTERKNHGV